MSARDLIDAIAAGDTVGIQTAFEAEMMSRVAARMEERRQQVAKNMFGEAVEVDEAVDSAKVHPNAIHVQQVKHEGQTKYKVHAVGKNFADGIKAGEHLSDTELDDFHEMGGKIKHVK